jgi:pimeloyl-ACP methyl ester carboxylesterase
VQESLDLVQVLEDLERRGLLIGPLGVYGVSYGAATAVHLAARDQRVQAVVAVAPFDDMRSVVPQYWSTVLPPIDWLMSPEDWQTAVDDAGRLAGVSPDLAQASLAASDSTAPLLVIHGDDDWMVPNHHGLTIYRHAAGPAEMVLLPGHGHVSVWADRQQQVVSHAIHWFNRWLAAEPAMPGARTAARGPASAASPPTGPRASASATP